MPAADPDRPRDGEIIPPVPGEPEAAARATRARRRALALIAAAGAGALASALWRRWRAP